MRYSGYFWLRAIRDVPLSVKVICTASQVSAGQASSSWKETRQEKGERRVEGTNRFDRHVVET